MKSLFDIIDATPLGKAKVKVPGQNELLTEREAAIYNLYVSWKMKPTIMGILATQKTIGIESLCRAFLIEEAIYHYLNLPNKQKCSQ